MASKSYRVDPASSRWRRPRFPHLTHLGLSAEDEDFLIREFPTVYSGDDGDLHIHDEDLEDALGLLERERSWWLEREREWLARQPPPPPPSRPGRPRS
jgi:hypothetical protein